MEWMLMQMLPGVQVLVLSCTPLRASGYKSLCEGRAWAGLQHLHLAHTR